MRDFRKYKVWELSHKVTLEVYHISKSFPKEELFGITSQIRRASASIAANIAEGCGRTTEKDFARFLTIANGSTSETEYFLILCRDLNLVEETKYYELNDKLNQIKRSLFNLINKLNK